MKPRKNNSPSPSSLLLITTPTILLLLFISLIITPTTPTTGGTAATETPQVLSSLCPTSINRIKSVISTKAWTLTDPLATGYAVLTYGGLGVEVPKAGDVCKYLQKSLDSLDESSKVESIFVISSAISKVPSCKVTGAVKPAVRQTLEKLLKEGTTPQPTTQDILYALESSKLLPLTPPLTPTPAQISSLLKTSIKSDDSPQSIGYALWATAAATKPGQKPTQSDLWDRIEDVIAQADEVDKQYLQFEGGLSVTAAVVNGIVRLAEVGGGGSKGLGLSNEQVVKFGNYLVSRKTVSTPRGSWLFVSALEVLSRNKFSVPIHIGLTGSPVLSSTKKDLTIRAVDLMGKPVDVTVMLESLNEKSEVGNKGALTDVQFIQGVQDSADKSLFKWDLKSKALPKGFYNAVFSAKSSKNDKTLILIKSSVEIKVTSPLGPTTTRVGIADSDTQHHHQNHASKTQWTDLNKGQKLPKALELEPSQKLVVKVAASDVLHQVFVIFRNKETRREVAFIAQVEGGEGGEASGGSKREYKLELDLTTNAKDLAHTSGLYELILVLGDFLIEDSVEWGLGEVSLGLAGGKGKSGNPLYSIAYGVRGEIKHEFRKPDPRPPRVLSDAFTVLVCVLPLLVLVVMWIRIGANIKNFPLVSLSAIGFHVGLAGLFGVYTIFWLRLTMFEALKWMILPGLITFISGHRMLAQISEKRVGGGGTSSVGGGGGVK